MSAFASPIEIPPFQFCTCSLATPPASRTSPGPLTNFPSATWQWLPRLGSCSADCTTHMQQVKWNLCKHPKQYAHQSIRMEGLCCPQPAQILYRCKYCHLSRCDVPLPSMQRVRAPLHSEREHHSPTLPAWCSMLRSSMSKRGVH